MGELRHGRTKQSSVLNVQSAFDKASVAPIFAQGPSALAEIGLVVSNHFVVIRGIILHWCVDLDSRIAVTRLHLVTKVQAVLGRAEARQWLIEPLVWEAVRLAQQEVPYLPQPRELLQAVGVFEAPAHGNPFPHRLERVGHGVHVDLDTRRRKLVLGDAVYGN